MVDFLRYRLPGQEPVEVQGTFLPIPDLNGMEGFIISDFNQKAIYVFQEGRTDTQDFAETVEPYVISREDYLKTGRAFLKKLNSEGLGKAIYSRIKKIPYQNKDNSRLFIALEKAYPEAFVYELKSHKLGHWIGATPEILLKGRGGIMETVALAATKKIDDTSPWGDKELEEQELVADFVELAVQRSGAHYSRSERKEYKAGPVKHLINTFYLEGLSRPVELLRNLHPTPAVSGLPRDKAIELIQEYEVHDRGLYTGFLGITGGDSQLYVNLRCAQIIGDHAYLYVGGGYTKDSNVEKEWEETENKAKTLSGVIENL